MEFLYRTKAEELVVGKKHLVEVESDATLQQVLHLLDTHQILAAPVCEPANPAPDAGRIVPSPSEWGGIQQPGTGRVYASKKRYIGTVGVLDILLYISEVGQIEDQVSAATSPPAEMVEETKLGGVPAVPLVGKWIPLPLSHKVLDTPVSKIVGRSDESRNLLVADPHTSLYQVLGFLSMGFHRMLIPNFCQGHLGQSNSPSCTAVVQPSVDIGSRKEEYRMLTQTDVVRFLIKHEAQLGHYGSKSLDELGLVWPGVLSIPSDAPALSAMLAMRDCHVSAIAVVERLRSPSSPVAVLPEQPAVSGDTKPVLAASGAADLASGGKLVGTLSASDLRGCQGDLLLRLPKLSVLELLDELTLPSTMAPKGAPDQITARRSSTLRSTMLRAIEAHVHRVWITTEAPEYVLEGVVTLTDMIRAVRTAAISSSIPVEGGEEEQRPDMGAAGAWLDWWMGERLPLDRMDEAPEDRAVYTGKLL